jgi:pimeloyl-ACP methyl ester carboxylesterase
MRTAPRLHLADRRSFVAGGIAALGAAAVGPLAGWAAPASGGPIPIVIIHGAWYDSGAWHKVVPLLQARGHTVVTPDMPGYGKNHRPHGEISFDTYVDDVVRAVDSVPGRVMLVGHSLGGMFISQTAERIPDKIASLTYVCAFMLRNGESRISVAPQDPDSVALKYRIPAGEGLISFTREGFIESFYNDCSPEDVDYLLARVRPQPVRPLQAPLRLSEKNYGRIPRYYVKCLLDRGVTPAFQDKMIAASPVRRTFELRASHSPFMSMPRELAEVLLEVARESALQTR